MLIAILMLYFHSDLQQLYARSELRLPAEAASVNWRALHLGPQVDANFGLTTIHAGRDAEIDLIRSRDFGNTVGDVEFTIVSSANISQPTVLITTDKLIRVTVSVDGKTHKAAT